MSVTTDGPPGALSVNVSAPFAAPVEPGAKLTVIVQVDPTGRLVGQSSVWVKPEPEVTAMPPIAKGAPPPLVRVTIFVVVMPSGRAPNSSDPGSSPG